MAGEQMDRLAGRRRPQPGHIVAAAGDDIITGGGEGLGIDRAEVKGELAHKLTLLNIPEPDDPDSHRLMTGQDIAAIRG